MRKTLFHPASPSRCSAAPLTVAAQRRKTTGRDRDNDEFGTARPSSNSPPLTAA